MSTWAAWAVIACAVVGVACTRNNWAIVPEVEDFGVPQACKDADHVAIWTDSLPLVADTARQHIVSGGSALKHYPADLRMDYRAGSVRARFVIDTLGRVIAGSGFIEASSDEQFSRAVCYALPQLKWEPVLVNGQKAVVGLVHVPFTFEVK